jgi:hypothetical protein
MQGIAPNSKQLNMRVAIMQPYFFPYIGYFQLINAVDKFVVYDNIKFTKKGWINRNRILVNGKDEYITIPLKKDSDYLNICQREWVEVDIDEKKKILRRIYESYKKAPQFSQFFPIVEEVINFDNKNLFSYLHNGLSNICQFLDIKTEFITSSTLPIDHTLKSQEKVIALCKSLDATHYINPIGGTELYSREVFTQNDIELAFIKTNNIQYPQFNTEYIPWLSIIDVMMFNEKEKVKDYINNQFTFQ